MIHARGGLTDKDIYYITTGISYVLEVDLFVHPGPVQYKWGKALKILVWECFSKYRTVIYIILRVIKENLSNSMKFNPVICW
jgi:hypothetical protein